MEQCSLRIPSRKLESPVSARLLAQFRSMGEIIEGDTYTIRESDAVRMGVGRNGKPTKTLAVWVYVDYLAEAVRFELTNALRRCRFSRPVVS